jgi:hypothetical protein
MNIADEFQQVSISVDENGLVPSLEEMADTSALLVEPCRIAQHKILHQPRKRNVRNLKKQVNVVRHEAKSLDAIPKSYGALLEKLVKVVSVRVLKKKGIASIAANNDVIKITREMNTWFTWHVEIFSQNV